MSHHSVASREPLLAIALGLMFVFAPAAASAGGSAQAQDAPQYGEPAGASPSVGQTTAPSAQTAGSDPAQSTSPLAIPPDPPAPPAAPTPPAAPAPPAAEPATAPDPQAQAQLQAHEHSLAQAHAHHAAGQAGRGFVMSASLGVRPSLILVDGTPSAQAFSLQGGLAIGFKYKRVVLTLGVDFGGTDNKKTFSTDRVFNVLVIPGLQVALYRSRDQRVELIGGLRVGAGTSIVSSETSSPSPVALVMYEIAPGVRYWAHKQLAIQALAGAGGQYAISTSSTAPSTVGVHSLVASLGAIGVF